MITATIAEALPGYIPPQCTPDLFAELILERPALRSAWCRVHNALDQVRQLDPSDVRRQKLESISPADAFAQCLRSYLHQDHEAYMLRQLGGTPALPHLGDVHEEYQQWLEVYAGINHLDFISA
ncbi:hypothetical protein CQ010_01460 [Arthrobacter sp. MYb211]|uniref:hypothetical protein n=1 Tax=unclassified Arthrobacter TaxID=235627 RepID=UPI000CFC7891|nr:MULTISPECIES: hypothetical protein [unclassified Arthrobacter]PRA13342.1 hypothetical protein CQ015_03715 [Arthrobacter sp. MYb221]PRC10539.1 hypothetical protein CQ010_01460 [Arthrobacter sp. MYb211]